MRVIAGERKGMPLKAVSGMTTRPTTDKVKESLFNILGPFFEGGVALDLFAGSGGLGIEALSRGMEKAIFIEKDGRAFHNLKENISKCRYEECTEVYRNDATRALKLLIKREVQADLIFLDPPYKKHQYYEMVEDIVSNGVISKEGTIVCEHDTETDLPDAFINFHKFREEKYGGTIISFYRLDEEEGDCVE
ncbi:MULTISPECIES: 16S rRNA (guanine(966)-N(2))-methyltransferase RsmD [unclassified Rummeliibacillus]|uniref:16S rRNA (guanine(966)-N(2))-methyltransferase RsmD n=1 Tax=unclassified Rummeliibacillus TaxID=2622809 RepID=UPI000E66B172|nr:MULTISPECIES: 16S rRNA (guanine(966)-N(2))-methyltransferase RsmD [unclassified Rummeliibacillus]RIJ69144.1 16S rRNA (guanine(966)-N(2))-methyltransferase RsmD [Rummeliibacillus sp. POC4]RPJ94370.1 16S rRNA (guanine(966)-N(2))-methyltransferase RsmD [Rummeliibacillus sp. TYF005]